MTGKRGERVVGATSGRGGGTRKVLEVITVGCAKGSNTNCCGCVCGGRRCNPDVSIVWLEEEGRRGADVSVVWIEEEGRRDADVSIVWLEEEEEEGRWEDATGEGLLD